MRATPNYQWAVMSGPYKGMTGLVPRYVALAGAVDAAGRVVRRLGNSIGPSP